MKRYAIEKIEAVADGQHGVFLDEQAFLHDVTPSMLAWHSRHGGRWGRVAPNVFEVLAREHDWRRPLMAAALSLGPPASISHRGAGALLGLDGIDVRVVEATIGDGRAHPGWHLYRRDPVPPSMFTAGIPHTLPLRTIRDLCSVLDDDHLEMAIESALRRRLITLTDLDAAVAEAGWKGVQRLRRVLALRPRGAPATGSELETRFIQVVRPLPIPDPVRQFKVVRHGEVIAVLDLAWPEARLFAETDGGVHERLEALRRDRQRQNDIVAFLGWRPLRFTWSDVVYRAVTTRRVVLNAYSVALAV